MESEERLRETQQLAKLGTWQFDIEDEKITWSDETFRIIGRSPADGEPSLEGILSTIHPDDAGPLMELIVKAQETGEPYRIEVRHRQPDGTYKHVLSTGTAFIQNGKVKQLFGSVMDITEFRQSEATSPNNKST